jgi:sulfite reductase (NADPH) flavoprotein alpha-component
MSFAPPTQPFSLLPESAPFTPEQRAWLNGFFSGLISVDGAVTPLSPAESAALMSGALAKDPLADADDGEAPWHDQTLPLPERMKLAEGRPLRRRLMAAMAQQDCGQCGYNCQDYSDAISRKTEERLNLCVPGGKETARMLKTLHAELGAPPAVAKTSVPAEVAEAAAPAVAASARATIRRPPPSCPARVSTSPDPPRRPGTSSSTSRVPASTMWWGIPSASSRPTIPRSPMR